MQRGYVMPITDRRRPRIVTIEYEADERFANLPLADRVTMVLLTGGRVRLTVNGGATEAAAPCILMLSQYDAIRVEDGADYMAKSFSFRPTFMNYVLTFDRLAADDFPEPNDKHDASLINMFLRRNDRYNGVIALPPHIFFRIYEWLNIMGAETLAQSDGRWTCRIRRYLLQILYLLEDVNLKVMKGVREIDLILEYIHTNYSEELTLEHLCKVANTNRTTLNRQFREQTGSTVIDYVLTHRLKIAADALSHTNLKLNEIAAGTGFKCESYFIRQFKRKMGLSPIEYRKDTFFKREEEKQMFLAGLG
jgi:AraC-like DNA-binding protein